VQGLFKSFGPKVVDRLDLTIHLGEFYALLGANDAGKTTTLHMIAGLAVPVAAILLGKVALGVAVTVPLLVFLAGQLVLFFISMLAAMDEMPALVASAPVAPSAPPRAALAVTAQASLQVVGLLVLAVLARRRVWPLCCCSAWRACWPAIWRWGGASPPPQPRRLWQKRERHAARAGARRLP